MRARKRDVALRDVASGLDQSEARSLELHPDFPQVWQGDRHLGCHLLPSQAHSLAAELEVVEKPGLKLALMWYAGITGNGSTCCLTMLASAEV